MTRTATDTAANLASPVGSAAVWFQITDPADPADVDRVVAAFRRSDPRCGDCRVIAIDGPSGSGKTTLAQGVVERLGCPVVHMDEIFPGWNGLAAASGLVTEQVLEPIAAGRVGAHRVWDWEGSTWGGRVELPRTDVLVIEGCGSSVQPAGRYAAVRVWVDAPRELRMARGLERDGETFAPHWQRWADQEDVVFGRDRTRERADVVIDTSTWR